MRIATRVMRQWYVNRADREQDAARRAILVDAAAKTNAWEVAHIVNGGAGVDVRTRPPTVREGSAGAYGDARFMIGRLQWFLGFEGADPVALWRHGPALHKQDAVARASAKDATLGLWDGCKRMLLPPDGIASARADVDDAIHAMCEMGDGELGMVFENLLGEKCIAGAFMSPRDGSPTADYVRLAEEMSFADTRCARKHVAQLGLDAFRLQYEALVVVASRVRVATRQHLGARGAPPNAVRFMRTKFPSKLISSGDGKRPAQARKAEMVRETFEAMREEGRAVMATNLGGYTRDGSTSRRTRWRWRGCAPARGS